MGEFRTVISANIPVSLAERLKNKTKGTRSRVVARALRAYLDDKDAFDITDYETRRLMVVLLNRNDCPNGVKVMIAQELGVKL